MQQVFQEDSTRGGETKPLIRFPLPVQPAPIAASTATKKRPRSPSGRESAAASFTVTSHVKPLTPEECTAFCRFLEFGEQTATASTIFFRSVKQGSSAAQHFAHNAALSNSSVAHQYQWCFVGLRHAMSLLCRVVALDSAGYYLRTVCSSKNGSGATVLRNGAPLTCAGDSTAAGPVTTLELYCRFQAVELELEDAVLRTEAAAQTGSVPDAVREQLRSDMDAVAACIEQSLNALEDTLVEMLLGSFPGANLAYTKATDLSNSPSLEYVGKMLRGLPALLQAEQWPAQFVCDRSCFLHDCDQKPENTATIESSSSPSPSFPPTLEEVLLSVTPATDVLSGKPCFVEQLGGAATSLALRSLFDLLNADLWNLLGVATASPISRLAALEKLAMATSNGSAMAARPSRPVVDIETIKFQEILIRAWNRHYGALGLRRLLYEMQILFHQYRMRVLTKSRGAGEGSGVTATDVCELWATWLRSLQKLTAVFLSKLSSSGRATSDMFSASQPGAHSCDFMRRHAVPDRDLAEIQKVALRVVSKLQTVDTKGWFAIPAFDLTNLDFTSLRYWITSPVFGRKSKREAYRSLCRVLERMVDNCVREYGPTHAFSDAITTVRQQLVDVSRTEELL